MSNASLLLWVDGAGTDCPTIRDRSEIGGGTMDGLGGRIKGMIGGRSRFGHGTGFGFGALDDAGSIIIHIRMNLQRHKVHRN